MRLLDLSFTILAVTAVAGCSEDTATLASNAETPPTSGSLDIDAWISEGSYKDWACEPAVHAARAPSPHGFNRVCSNALIASSVTGTGAWPKGAAAVKELHASLESTTPIAYAVYLKTEADSDGGNNWYWYERLPDGVVADGYGDTGPAKSICVGCHVEAGVDEEHTPSAFGRDLVYTPVR